MRLRHIPGAKEFVISHPTVLEVENATMHRGRWQQLFGNSNQLHLEIGMGRGRFITASAKNNPEINYLGLELRAEVMLDAIAYAEPPLPNLRFLYGNAVLLPELFAVGEVECIYINFPDPWPKSRHAKRRLTSKTFLPAYRDVLADNGQIRFKTDNQPLFEWSLSSFEEGGWTLHSHGLAEAGESIQTEYERRFRARGMSIYQITAGK